MTVAPAAQIVASTTGPIPLGNQYDVPPIPAWRGDRMVIIGDAARPDRRVWDRAGRGCTMQVAAALAARDLDADVAPRRDARCLDSGRPSSSHCGTKVAGPGCGMTFGWAPEVGCWPGLSQRRQA